VKVAQSVGTKAAPVERFTHHVPTRLLLGGGHAGPVVLLHQLREL
jgi:hypothetical protein